MTTWCESYSLLGCENTGNTTGKMCKLYIYVYSESRVKDGRSEWGQRKARFYEDGQKGFTTDSLRVLLRLQHQQPGEINKAKKVPETA